MLDRVELGPAQLAAFETDGAVLLRGLLDPAWIEQLRDAIPDLLDATYDPVARMTSAEAGKVRQCDGMWRFSEPFARFLFRSPVGAVASAAMRSTSARLYEDLLLYKNAGADGAAGWHRDSPYWPLSGRQMASTWFTLEGVTADTGAMRFLAGSHLDDDDVVRSTFRLSDAERSRQRELLFEADPGDVVLFHPRALHTAYGSAPDRPRRTFTLRFVGDDVRWRPRRELFHPWMSTCGLEKGAELAHPWFPVVHAGV